MERPIRSSSEGKNMELWKMLSLRPQQKDAQGTYVAFNLLYCTIVILDLLCIVGFGIEIQIDTQMHI